MDLVDTHCHIQSAGLDKGERITRQIWAKDAALTGDRLVQNAVNAGVTKLICVGCDLDDSHLAVDFAQTHEPCWASVGIHPHEAQHFAGQPDKLAKFAEMAKEPKVVAIGECGFDFYYNHSPRAAQIEVLKFQLELAQKHDLPLIFHVREAFDEFWPVFDQYEGLRGVLHSFTDSVDNLQKALAKELYIGVNGIATFAKDDKLLETYKNVPLEKLLLETDAPLTPTPDRGKINEPKRLGGIAEFVARLRSLSLEEMAAATTVNAKRLFGLER